MPLVTLQSYDVYEIIQLSGISMTLPLFGTHSRLNALCFLRTSKFPLGLMFMVLIIRGGNIRVLFTICVI